MVKFLKKIRQRLIGEGNLKSYLTYAVGEILLVMIGILLALQVNNWNENNKYRKEEQKILKSLQIEFRDNITSLREVLDFHKGTIAKIEQVLQDLSADDPTDPDLPTKAMNAVFGKTYDPQFGVLHALLSSDKINLIGHELLRNRIAKVPGLLEDYTEDEKLVVNSIYDFYLPELFRLKPENLSSGMGVVANYLKFLVPSIEGIVTEGEALRQSLAEDMQLIESQID